MANTRVSLVRLCKTENGWRRFPVAYSKNGRIKSNWVIVRGEEKEYPQGRYQLRYYEGRIPVYEDAGDNPADALQSQFRQSNLLLAQGAARRAGATVEGVERRVSLPSAYRRFLEAAESRGSMEAKEVYQTSVSEFLRVTGKTFVDEIEAGDLLKYQRHLRESGKADRTVSNRFANVCSFLRFCDLDVKKLAPSRPRYEKKLPQIYSPEEIDALFTAIKSKHYRLIFEMLLKCGLREQEAVYLEWSNVDLSRGIIRVRANPKYKFKVKDCEERDVPIPKDLLERLREYRMAHPKTRLITGTAKDKPNTHLLRTLKREVNRASLQCRNCEGCRKHNECKNWFLHKFRATYITTLLRNDIDLRTAMRFSGHSDLDSVMRYLSPADSESVRTAINKIVWR